MGEGQNELQKVLDPLDIKGIKNSYIDYNLKYYLRKNLRPEKSDIVIEIGCGIGRLVEYLSHYVRFAYGIDLIDKFIDDCNDNIYKNDNTSYFKIKEINKIRTLDINKAFIVWMLMYFENDIELVQALSKYNSLLTKNHSMFILEQVKAIDDVEMHDDNFYCKYRTINNYIKLFEDAGYKVVNTILLGERKRGFFIRLILKFRSVYNLLPNYFTNLSPLLFIADKLLMDMSIIKRHVHDMVPIDVLFVLKKSS